MGSGPGTMTNPDHYEDDSPVDPVLLVLGITGRILTGIALATAAATAVVVYASARAGRHTRARVDEAVEEIGREIRDAGRELSHSARAALHATAGLEAQRGEAPAMSLRA